MNTAAVVTLAISGMVVAFIAGKRRVMGQVLEILDTAEARDFAEDNQRCFDVMADDQKKPDPKPKKQGWFSKAKDKIGEAIGQAKFGQ